MKNKTIFTIIIAATILIIGLKFSLAEGGNMNQEERNNANRFQLIILKQGFDDLGLGYEYEEAFGKLKSIDSSDNLFAVGMDEIESYNWTRQSITLNSRASSELIKRSDDEYLKWAGHTLGSTVIELSHHGFLVKVDDKLLYCGVILDAMSQMAIEYPAIHMQFINGKIVLNILPVHIPFVDYDPISEEKIELTPIMDYEVKSTTDSKGLSDWANTAIEGWVSDETAKRFRPVIRDSRVREIMEKAGKLIENQKHVDNQCILENPTIPIHDNQRNNAEDIETGPDTFEVTGLEHPYLPLVKGSVWSYQATGATYTTEVISVRSEGNRLIAEVVQHYQTPYEQETHMEYVVTPEGQLPLARTTVIRNPALGGGEEATQDVVSGIYLPRNLGPKRTWSWSMSTEYPPGSGGGMDYRATAQVIGVEQVTVPAGTYKAVHIQERIETVSRSMAVASPEELLSPHVQINDIYYALGVGLVKYSVRGMNGYQSVAYLVEYRQKK